MENGKKKDGKLLSGIRKANDWVVILVFVALTLTVVLQVFFRYVLQHSLRWTEEAARYLLIWLVLLGSAVAMRHRAHLQVDILTAALPPKPRRILESIIGILTLVFLAIMTVQGAYVVTVTISQVSPAMQLPMGLIYAALPIGGALTFMETAISFGHSLKPKALDNEGG